MNDNKSSFCSQPVICLEDGDFRLYAAIIQFIELHKTYWIRPLCLVEKCEIEESITPLHRTSDVIVPQGTFRLAYDTEIIEFWTALYDDLESYEDNSLGRAKLHQFLHRFFCKDAIV